MFAMKRSALFVGVLVFALAIGFAARTAPTRAQDEMDAVVCDSTLVTLLYIAEHDYGFHSMLDVAQLDKGQYAPLFDAMMTMMEEEGMMEETPEDAMMEEEMGDESMMEGMTMLTPGVVEGEDTLCTDLRAELDAFFYDTFTHEMMASE